MRGLANLIPFILIALVFYFLLFRPQRRRQQQVAQTQATLDVGSEVMLGSGIYGTVASLEDETIHLRLDETTTVKVARQAIVKVVEPADYDQSTATATYGPGVDELEESYQSDSYDAGTGDRHGEHPHDDHDDTPGPDDRRP